MRFHNRQLKAAFWTDGELLRWPLAKRMMYAGLVQLADDSGCLENDAFTYKLQLFPSPIDTDITVELIAQWIDELIVSGKLLAYEAGGKQCVYLKNFHKHQRIDNPSAPEVPLPTWLTWEIFPTNNRKGKYIVSDSVADSSYAPPAETEPVRTNSEKSSYTVLTDTESVRTKSEKSSSNQNRNQNLNQNRNQKGDGAPAEVAEVAAVSETPADHLPLPAPAPPKILLRDEFQLTRELAEYSQREFGKPLFDPTGVTMGIVEKFEKHLTELSELAMTVTNRMVLAPIDDKCSQDYWRNQLTKTTTPFTSGLLIRVIGQSVQDLAERKVVQAQRSAAGHGRYGGQGNGASSNGSSQGGNVPVLVWGDDDE
jgi:hypothetical protein